MDSAPPSSNTDDGGEGRGIAVRSTSETSHNSNSLSYNSSSYVYNPDIVELATLRLPSHAINSGMESGEGDHVILEATQETIDHLTSDLQDHEQHQCMTQISAVVDLEVLSELVGISEEEFIADLHADASEHANQYQQQQQHEQQQESHDEETPLLSAAASAATSSAGTDQQDHESWNSDYRITLPADAFIETLAEALHAQPQAHAHSHTMPPMAEETEEDVLAESTSASDLKKLGAGVAESASTEQQPQNDAVIEAAATRTEDDQHLGHDAFLLNIPNYESATGTLEDHYVLALPEILVEASLASTQGNQVDAGSLLSSLRSLESEDGGAFVALTHAAYSILPEGKLPTDVQAVHLEAHKHQPTKDDPAPLHLDLVVKHRVPIIGYVILISGLVALASVGAALDLQQGPSPTLKTLWRQLATSIVLLPLVLKSIRRDGFPKLSWRQWLQLPLCAIAYAYMTLAFVIALELTTLANAFVLSNMTSLVIIAGRVTLGMPVLRSEGMGAVVGFIGAAICANDASRTLAKAAALMETATEGDKSNSGDAMLGNIIALSASFGTASYFIVAKNLRASMDLFVFMFCVMLFGSAFLVAYIVLNGEEFSWDMHPDHGMFGWLVWWMPDRLPLELYMAIVCNCLGTTGYIAVMKYFEPIVPATVMLMEPVVGALLGVAAGTAKMPGIQTWFGDVVVAIGTFCVIWSGSKKTEKIDATSALRPTSTGGDDDASAVVSIVKSPMIRKSGPSRTRSRSIDTQDTPTKVVWDHS